MNLLLSSLLNMFIFIILAISIPLTISEFTNSPVFIDSEFSSFFEEFKSDAKKYNTELNLRKMMTIFSDNVGTGIAAYCLPATNTIVISSRVWQTLHTRGKKALLYHEWGHCALRRDHSYDNIGTCPTSLMYPTIDPMLLCYNNETEDYYNRELFINPHNYRKFYRRN